MTILDLELKWKFVLLKNQPNRLDTRKKNPLRLSIFPHLNIFRWKHLEGRGGRDLSLPYGPSPTNMVTGGTGLYFSVTRPIDITRPTDDSLKMVLTVLSRMYSEVDSVHDISTSCLTESLWGRYHVSPGYQPLWFSQSCGGSRTTGTGTQGRGTYIRPGHWAKITYLVPFPLGYRKDTNTV